MRKSIRVGELGGGPLEGGERFLVTSGIGGGVGNAPVDDSGVARKLGADLAHTVTQADHVVEALPCELVEVLGPAPGRSMPNWGITRDRVRVHRLGVAARALLTVTAAPARCRSQRLGHLRP